MHVHYMVHKIYNQLKFIVLYGYFKEDNYDNW